MVRIFLRRTPILAFLVLCASMFVVPAQAEDPKPDPRVNVTLERTDSLGDDVHVGDKVTYTLHYHNVSKETVVVYPRFANIAGVAVEPGNGACRWAGLKPDQKASCPFGYHITDSKDVANGFTPEVSVDITKDREGNEVLETLPKVTAAPIAVDPAPRPSPPHPSEKVMDPLPDGTKRSLADADVAGYHCHRIPALTQAPNGWILAAWDGRPNNCADAPQANSIISRISKDGGKSWSKPITIAAGQPAAPKYGYSDPSFVTDRETGKIFIFFVKSYDSGIAGSALGTDPNNRKVIHSAVAESADNGETWSQPKVITADITNEPDREYGRFAASGEGIQLRYGKYKGRLVQQFSINYAGSGLDMKAVSVYSDDHGATWKAGKPFGTKMDENKVVELSDGKLMVNSRASDGNTARKVAYSSDGGETYTDAVVNPDLIDPRNNASIIRAYPNAPENSRCAKILLFSNAASTNGRKNGKIRISFNDGRMWTTGKVFEAGAMSYSTMTPLAESGKYAMLYETNGTSGSQSMTYMPFSMEWLDHETGCSVADSDTQPIQPSNPEKPKPGENPTPTPQPKPADNKPVEIPVKPNTPSALPNTGVTGFTPVTTRS